MNLLSNSIIIIVIIIINPFWNLSTIHYLFTVSLVQTWRKPKADRSKWIKSGSDVKIVVAEVVSVAAFCQTD